MNYQNYVFCLRNFLELTSNLYVNSKDQVLESDLVPAYQITKTFNIVSKHQKLSGTLEDIWPSNVNYLVNSFLKDIDDLQYLLDFVDYRSSKYYEYLLDHYQGMFKTFLDNQN